MHRYRFHQIAACLAAIVLPIATVVADDPPKKEKPKTESKSDGAKPSGESDKPSATDKKKSDDTMTKALNLKPAKQSDQEKKEEPKKSTPKKNVKPNAKKQAPKKDGAQPADAKKDAGKKADAAAPKSETKSDANKPADKPKPKVKAPAKPAGLVATADMLKQISWRSVGPANMSGRITDISIDNNDSSLWYVATASGGMLKSTNHGVVMQHQFDGEETVSIGAVAHAASDANLVWVGTGEANPRNSVSYGNGVYKSTDGGKTWQHMGLEESYQVARILIDPKNPDTVYVGAAGRLYGTNRQRGVFKSTDGGKTWDHSLYVNDNTGVIDMIMDPEDPNTIIAAMWDRQRDEFDSWPGSVKKPEGIDGYDPIRKWGKGAGLYKTTDGGENWTRLTKGLPPGKMGRIGLDWQTGGSHSIYAIIDCEDIGKGPLPQTGFLGIVVGESTSGDGDEKKTSITVDQIIPGSPVEKLNVKQGDVITAIDGNAIADGTAYLDVLRKKKPGRRVFVDLQRGDETLQVQTVIAVRPGSRTALPTAYLGVTGEDKDGAVVLKTVVKDSPAATAGLKPGDVISAVDGAEVKGYDALLKTLGEKAVEDPAEITIIRGEETLTLNATMGERAGARTTTSRAIMGIQGEDQEGGGARMLVITDGGPSATAGMKAGDVVLKVGKNAIANYSALIAEIRGRQPGDLMEVVVRRDKKEIPLKITLGDRNVSSRTRPYTYSYFGQQPNIQDMQGADGYRYGGIYRSDDAGETWQRVNSLNTRPMYFSVIRVDPNDAQRVYVLGVSQFASRNGGVTFESNFGRGVHADAHDLWIDPKDGRHMVIAGDGGVYASYDRGQTWNHINTAAIGQFYHVAIAPGKPYRVVGGLQDNGSWMGPAISRSGGAINEDWFRVGGGDGFQCRVDALDPDLVYYESQNGSIGRRHLKTGARASIRPPRERGREVRFNWETPFILSSHNSRLFYSAGNYVFRSYDRGNSLKRISPNITRTKRGSATELAESPRDPDLLYVGTDDGFLWVTKDGGRKWTRIDENLDAPGKRWVASIEASRYVTGRVYVTLDGHRSDDDNPYVYVSEDFGATFRALHKSLPRGSTRCLREDPKNKDLLYLGTEFAFWISLDRGANWQKANGALPTVAIHDLAFVPNGDEIVLATHGRSLWAGDVSVLRNLTAKSMASAATLYPIAEVTRWRTEPSRGSTSPRYVAKNPARGAAIWYSLAEDVEKVEIKISDISGRDLRTINASKDSGLHRVQWDLSARSSRGSGRAAGFRGGTFFVPTAPYRVALVVDEKEVGSQVVNVESDPSVPVGAVADEVYERQQLREATAARLKNAAKDAGVEVYKDN